MATVDLWFCKKEYDFNKFSVFINEWILSYFIKKLVFDSLLNFAHLWVWCTQISRDTGYGIYFLYIIRQKSEGVQ